MTEIARSAAASVVALLTHYSFDSAELTVEQLADQWLQAYSGDWVRSALIEALYQGRYKAVSVAQILAFWQRRGQSLYHFDPEFEQLICNRLPKKLSIAGQPKSSTNISANLAKKDKTAQNQLLSRARASLKPLSQPKAPDSLKADDSTVNRAEYQMLQAPEKVPLFDAGVSLDKVFPSSAQVQVARPELAAARVSQPIWLELGYPIHRFIPDTGSSNFHTKLSAFAQRLH